MNCWIKWFQGPCDPFICLILLPWWFVTMQFVELPPLWFYPKQPKTARNLPNKVLKLLATRFSGPKYGRAHGAPLTSHTGGFMADGRFQCFDKLSTGTDLSIGTVPAISAKAEGGGFSNKNDLSEDVCCYDGGWPWLYLWFRFLMLHACLFPNAMIRTNCD